MQYYSFAKEVTRAGVDPAKPELPEPPNPGGSGTQIGDAVGHLLDEAAGRQVAGIVVFSDGQNTGGRSPTEAAAARPRRQHADLHRPRRRRRRRLQDVAIVGPLHHRPGLGRRHGPRGRHHRIAGLRQAAGQGRAEGRRQAARHQGPDPPRHRAAAGRADLQGRQGRRPLPDGARPAAAGGAGVPARQQHRHRLRPRQRREDQGAATSRACRAGTSASSRTPCAATTAWAAGTEQGSRTSCSRRSGGASRPRQSRPALPRTLDELAEYHTVILGDVSPKMLDAGFLDLLVKAVRERGVGLIVEAGPLSHAAPVRRPPRTTCCRCGCGRASPGSMPRGVAVVPAGAGPRRRPSTRRCASTTTRAATRTPGRNAAVLLVRRRRDGRRRRRRCWPGTRSPSAATASCRSSPTTTPARAR